MGNGKESRKNNEGKEEVKKYTREGEKKKN